MFRSATVSGRVLLDSGLPSLPLSGGLAGVRVSLLDEYGAPVSDTTTTYTDENGDYYLKGALPGVYSLEYQLPAGTAFACLLYTSRCVEETAWAQATYCAPRSAPQPRRTVTGTSMLEQLSNRQPR